MNETAHTPVLAVIPTKSPRQFVVRRPDDVRMPPDAEWNDFYVEFSGYFGSYGPSMFAAAPALVEALQLARHSIASGFNTVSAISKIDAALSLAKKD